MKLNNLTSLSRTAAVCACSALLAAVSYAAPINYGDFDDFANGGVLEYQQVTESSSTDPTPLYGAPEVEVNQLDFDPLAFGSSAVNGAVDFTDGQVNFMIDSLPGVGITGFTINESGSYSFTGAATAATTAQFGVLAEVTILEIDGNAVSPIDLSFNTSDLLNAVTDPGFAAPWDLQLFVDLGPSISGLGSEVTLAEVVINNTLATASEATSGAFIDKKDFTLIPIGDLDPDNVVPEPTAAVLAVLAIGGIVSRRR